jgi:hypothetical protein
LGHLLAHGTVRLLLCVAANEFLPRALTLCLLHEHLSELFLAAAELTVRAQLSRLASLGAGSNITILVVLVLEIGEVNPLWLALPTTKKTT